MTSDNIIVSIKIRPLITREKKDNLPVRWKVQARSITQLDYNEQPFGEPFCFGKLFIDLS